MTFEITNPRQQIVSPTTHKLDKAALRQWWQMASFFKLFPKRIQDPFKNDAMRACTTFLVIEAFQVAFVFPVAVSTAIEQHREFAFAKLMVMAVVVWLSQAALLVLAFRNHRRIIQEVSATEDGLVLRSPSLLRKIRWSDISDVFLAGNTETGYDMYQLDCHNGESFLLSRHLNDCENLITRIESKIPRITRPLFDINYRLSDGFIDAMSLASAAIITAVLCILFNSHAPITWQMALVTLGICAVSLAHRWIAINKMPQLIRVSSNEIFLRCRGGSKLISWDQVREMKQLGGLLILKTRTTWFVLFASKKEPVKEKLLGHQRRLLSQKSVIR